MLFGGGVKKGHVHGQTADERPFTSVKDPVTIPDLHASLYRALGIPADLSYETEGRPFFVTQDGKGTGGRRAVRVIELAPDGRRFIARAETPGALIGSDDARGNRGVSASGRGVRAGPARRLDRGERPDFAAEQAELRSLLKTQNEAQKWPDYAGDGERFLGIRYALTCWVDEILIDSPWEREWNERKLEEQLYFTNDRAFRFWQQADVAQARSGTDALEVFYLCVMLGFRGEGPTAPQTLAGWRDAVEDQLARSQSGSWAGPQELQPDVYAAPRRGRDRLRLVLMALVVLLAVLIPTVTFLLRPALIGASVRTMALFSAPRRAPRS